MHQTNDYETLHLIDPGLSIPLPGLDLMPGLHLLSISCGGRQLTPTKHELKANNEPRKPSHRWRNIGYFLIGVNTASKSTGKGAEQFGNRSLFPMFVYGWFVHGGCVAGAGSKRQFLLCLSPCRQEDTIVRIDNKNRAIIYFAASIWLQKQHHVCVDTEVAPVAAQVDLTGFQRSGGTP